MARRSSRRTTTRRAPRRASPRRSAPKAARKAPKRKSSTTTRRSTSRGRPATKGRATIRRTRTRTTLAAKPRRANQSTSRATPRRVSRTVVRPRASVPRPRLTGGRIAQKPQSVRNIRNQAMRGVRGLQPPSMILGQSPSNRLATHFGMTQTNGGGTPVTVTYPNGKKVQMNLSQAAIQQYQKSGVKVSPQSQYYTTSGNASPQIPRIQNQSPPWWQNPPKQLHVTPHMKVKPNTRTNSNFGGMGANPWNPIELLGGSVRGLFGMSPQEKPESQYLPQQQNTQSTGYPTYTAMAQGQYQEQAFEESPQGFQSAMLGDDTFQPMDTVKNLASNQWVIIGGLAVGVLVVLKFVLGGRGGGGGGGKTVIL